MAYTWTTQVHNTTAIRNRVQLETWVHRSHGWELTSVMQCDTLDHAYEAAKTIRADRTFLDKVQSPVIIAAVRFTPRGHHRLVTWHGTYTEGDTNA